MQNSEDGMTSALTLPEFEEERMALMAEEHVMLLNRCRQVDLSVRTDIIVFSR